MERGTKRAVAFGLAAVTAMSLLLPAQEVSAGCKTYEIEDDFNCETGLGFYDSEIWSELGTGGTIKTTQITEPDKVLLSTSKVANGENTVLMSKEWFTKIKSVQFDIKIPKGGSWFGIDFADISNPEDYLGDFAEKGDPMCYGSYKLSEDVAFNIPGTDWKYWGFSDNNIAGEWVSVKIVSESANSGKVYFAPKGQKFVESKGRKITLGEHQSFYNCNLVLIDYHFTGYMLDNLRIETEDRILSEDFSDDKNQYFEAISILENKGVFTYKVTEEGAVRKLDFAGANAQDRLIVNKKVQAEDKYLTDTDMVLDASFTIDFSKATGQEEIAYLFGMSALGSDPFVGTYAYVTGAAGGRFVSYDADGKEHVLAAANYGKSLKGDRIRIQLNKKGDFQVSVNGKKVCTGSGVTSYRGYTGFVAATAIASDIYVDDFTLRNQIYHVITTKSHSDDFSINRLGSSGNSDFAYYAESGAINVTNGELAYEGCLDNTFFGSAYEYETYEMTFKLTSILATELETERQNATYLDNWIGIDFGKQSANTKQYGTYGMFLIRVTHPKDKTSEEWETADAALWRVEGSSKLKGETYTQVNPIPASYFKDITYDDKSVFRDSIEEGAAVCFKLVALQNQMELYMKRADEAEYTLYITVDNVNPEGWSGITCTGWTYWTIDDFAMTNTASIYNEAPEVVIEEPKTESLTYRGVGVEDLGWEEECLLNQGRSSASTLPIILGSVGVVLLLAAGGMIVYRYKKKGEKQSS